MGVDFKKRQVEEQGAKVMLQIWDYTSRERFVTMPHSYYRAAHGIFLMYDTTDLVTFRDLKKWLQEIQKGAGGNTHVVLIIGTKTDLTDKRQVAAQEAEEYCAALNIPW